MTLSERGNTVNVADETIEDLVNTEDTEGGVEGLRVWAESIDPDNRATQAVDTQNSIGEDVGDGSKGQRSDEDEDEGQKHHGSEVAPHTRARRGNKRTRKRKAPSDELDDHLAAFIYNSLLPGHDPQKGCRRKVLDFLYKNNSVGEYYVTGDIVWILNLHKLVSRSVVSTVPVIPLPRVATSVIPITLYECTQQIQSPRPRATQTRSRSM